MEQTAVQDFRLKIPDPTEDHDDSLNQCRSSFRISTQDRFGHNTRLGTNQEGRGPGYKAKEGQKKFEKQWLEVTGEQ